MIQTISINSVADLLAHAKAIEEEAMDRYRELATQMEIHHNQDVADLFRKMADIESLHVQKIIDRAGATDLPQIAPWDYQWLDEEAPEAIAPTDVHYLMTPHHALKLALRAEKSSFDFFSRVVESTAPGAVQDLARELKEEEHEHIQLMEAWLAKVPEPHAEWDHDPDPPNIME